MTRIKVYLGLIVLVLIVYGPSLFAGYHADDWSHSYIPREFSQPRDIWNPPFPFSASFRPTFVAHLWLLSQISEWSIPLARTWVLLLHGIASIVVFEFASFLFKGRELWVPSIAACWFAVAFSHFEVPTALTNSETPAALPLLLTIYLLARNWPLGRPRDQLVFGSMWIIALGAKEYALWIPVVWFGMHLLSKPRTRMSLGGWVTRMSPLLAIACAYLVRFLSVDRNAEDLALLREPSFSMEGIENLLSFIASLPLLDPAHPRWEGYLIGFPAPALLGMKVFLALAVVALVRILWIRKERRLVYIGLSLILGPLLLACWLPGPAASRHTYIPSAGFGILLAAAYSLTLPEKKRLATLALVAILFLQAAGSMGVAWKLTQITRQRESVTNRLSQALESVPNKKRVILDGLDPRLRVGMSLPFLFPDRKLETLEPSPLLQEQPMHRLRAEPPSDEEAVILEWDGDRFEKSSPSEYLQR